MTPDRWFVLSVRAPDPELHDELVEALLSLGGGAVQDEAGRLTTYIPPPPDAERFAVEAAARLGDVAGRILEVDWQWRDNEDWAREWRRGLRPRRIGDRLIVTPTWERPPARDGDIVISIDPQMAFGTGEHATTRGALRLLEGAVRPGDRVLDVGTGSAILAIAAAMLGAAEVLAVESDPDAMDNAHDNVQRNGVADRVELVCAEVDDSYLDAFGPGRFDVIVANVLSGVLQPLLPAFRRSLAEGGRVLLGGILDIEADGVLATGRAAGLAAVTEDREQEWWTGMLRAD